MVEPDPPRQPGTYHGLLSQLREEEIRHLPNLLVFWGSRGWNNRTHFAIDFTAKDCQKLEGQYYVFRTLESNGLQLNKHLSSHLEECRGDAFVLKALDYSWGDDMLLDDVMHYMEVLRKMSLYPEYVDVDDEILDCNTVQAVAGVLLREADGFAEPATQMDSDDEVS